LIHRNCHFLPSLKLLEKSDPLDDGDFPAAADAHGDGALAPAGAMQLVHAIEQAPGRADRMPSRMAPRSG
jgi:hypothetical protein